MPRFSFIADPAAAQLGDDSDMFSFQNDRSMSMSMSMSMSHSNNNNAGLTSPSAVRRSGRRGSVRSSLTKKMPPRQGTLDSIDDLDNFAKALAKTDKDAIIQVLKTEAGKKKKKTRTPSA